MSAFVRFFALCLLFLSHFTFAQEFQYRMEGLYNVGVGGSSIPVNFTLSWNESSDRIQGIYSDNYFTSSSAVKGNLDNVSRNMNVTLPPSVSGLKTLALQFSRSTALSGSETVRMAMYDSTGIPLFNSDQSVQIFSQPTATSAPTTCTIGFGALSGYCGVYSGTFTKAIDTANLCQSVATSDTVLDLSDDGRLNIKMNYNPGLTDLPAHQFGDLPHSPMSQALNVASRQCGALPGTTFALQNCRTLNLVGNFKEQDGDKIFTGTYIITDDSTKESCTFNLLLERRAIR